jgi:hypothetical protein
VKITKYPDGRIYKPTQINVEEAIKKPKKNKYGNEKFEVDGQKYDSKKELKGKNILDRLMKAGYVKSYEMQVKYVLQEGFRNTLGKKNREITWTADVVVIDSNDKEYVIDFKGFPDQKFPIKRKLFEYKFGKPVYVIKKPAKELHTLFVKE